MKFKVEGLDEYITQLTKLNANTETVIKRAIYPAAGVVAEAIKQGTPVDTGDLRDSVVIRRMKADNTGYVSTDVTFSGEDRKGVPNAVKARVIESGRSDQPGRRPDPFVKRSVSRVKAEAESEIKRVFEEEINKIMNEKG